MDAGKHVYVEKPMTRYLSEAFEIYDACKRTGKLLQVGSQGCSDRKWHKAAEWIRAGKIGPIVMSQGSYMRNNPHGEWNYTIAPWAKPEDINWKMWLGEQIKTGHSFDPDHYFRWRKYYPYCSGLLGDLFPHKLHPYMLATGNPEFPVRVAAVGSKAFKTDLNQVGRKPEQATQYVRDVEEIIQLVAEFPSGYVMHITSSSVNEVGSSEMIRGHKATLTMGGNKAPMDSAHEDLELIANRRDLGGDRSDAIAARDLGVSPPVRLINYDDVVVRHTGHIRLGGALCWERLVEIDHLNRFQICVGQRFPGCLPSPLSGRHLAIWVRRLRRTWLDEFDSVGFNKVAAKLLQNNPAWRRFGQFFQRYANVIGGKRVEKSLLGVVRKRLKRAPVQARAGV
jgi:hypothetical protein